MRKKARLRHNMSEKNAQIDALIMGVSTAEWQKTAMVISSVFDHPDFNKDECSAQEVAERLYILVDNGQLDVQGNMRRWRDSEVKVFGS